MMFLTLLVALLVVTCAFAKKLGDKDSRSLEIMLPMRDGTHLHTEVHLPREKFGKVPTVMDRSPYGKFTHRFFLVW